MDPAVGGKTTCIQYLGNIQIIQNKQYVQMCVCACACANNNRMDFVWECYGGECSSKYSIEQRLVSLVVLSAVLSELHSNSSRF